jgi:hypothetical protein
MMDYDFSNLTDAQQRVLTFQGWQAGDRMRQPHKTTVKKLIARGLVIERDHVSGKPPITFHVTEYEVPMHIHIAWCNYCAELEAAKLPPPTKGE